MTEPDQSVVLRRRRLTLAALALAAIGVVVVVALFKSGGGETAKQTRAPAAAVRATPIERIALRATDKSRAYGVADVVRRGSRTELRVLAVGLRPTSGNAVYKVRLVGSAIDPLTVGSARTDSKGTMIGAAPISLDQLKKYSRLEIALGQPRVESVGAAVLRGKLPQ